MIKGTSEQGGEIFTHQCQPYIIISPQNSKMGMLLIELTQSPSTSLLQPQSTNSVTHQLSNRENISFTLTECRSPIHDPKYPKKLSPPPSCKQLLTSIITKIASIDKQIEKHTIKEKHAKKETEELMKPKSKRDQHSKIRDHLKSVDWHQGLKNPRAPSKPKAPSCKLQETQVEETQGKDKGQ